MRPTTPRILALLLVTLFATGCAAHRHLQKGQAALTVNDPVTARHHFARALEHDPKLAGQLEFTENYRVARRDAAVVEGEQALRRFDPDQAIERFEAALGYEPGWPAAAEGLARAHRRAAEAAYQQAVAEADAGDLEAARSCLDTALQHQPDHVHANAALASLSLLPDQQPAAYRQGQQLTVDRQWDAALSAYRQTVTADPAFFPARAAVHTTLDAAAADMLREGNTLLAQARFDDAEAAIRRTLDYRLDHVGVQPALGRVDLARGDADLADDRPGSALLWFRRAREHFAASSAGTAEPAEQRITSTIAMLRDRHRLMLQLIPHDNDTPDELAEDLIGRTQARLEARPAAALGFASDGRPVEVTIQSLDLPPAEVREEALLHPYEVQYEVPNPDRRHLEFEVDRLERCIDDLCRREAQLERRYRHFHHAYPHVPSPGCPPEYHRVYRELDHVRRELRTARRDLRHLSFKLRHEPFFVTRTRTEYWPYTRLIHTRTVELVASFALPGLTPQSVTARLTDRDTTISPARPDLGLYENPLDLRTDADLTDDLLGKAANRLAHDLAEALVRERVAALRREAERLHHHDPVASTEARIAADVLNGD